jgi:hypothetical protein
MPNLLARLSLRWRSSEHQQSSSPARRKTHDDADDDNAGMPPPQRGNPPVSALSPSLLQLSKEVAAPAEPTEPSKVDAATGALVANASEPLQRRADPGID